MSLQTAEGVPRQIFPNLEELVSKYEKPGQGLVVHLSKPIMRNSFCQRGRRVKSEPNVYGKSPDKGSEGTLNLTSTPGSTPQSGHGGLVLRHYSKELHPDRCNFYRTETQHLLAPACGQDIEPPVLGQLGRRGKVLSEKLTWSSFCDHVQSTHGNKYTYEQVFTGKKQSCQITHQGLSCYPLFHLWQTFIYEMIRDKLFHIYP